MSHTAYNSLLFRIAFVRARPCYCYGCICLTPDERAYERRVFRLVRAWSREMKRTGERSPPSAAN
jgi:hypothetical protein